MTYTIEKGLGLVVSDLHLSQLGSTGKRALKTLCSKIGLLKPTLVVLNGDIVEGLDLFGAEPRLEHSVKCDIEEVRRLVHCAVSANPNCQVVYVLGNHDAYREIRTALEALQQEDGIRGHLQLEENLFRCRDTLFLHGDVPVHQGGIRDVLLGHLMGKPAITASSATGRENAEPGSNMRSLQCTHGKATTHIASRSYFVSVFDQELNPLFMPLKRYAHSILENLKTHNPAAIEGIKNIMIGHIHPTFGSRYDVDGYRFRVTGPATAKSRNCMYSFAIDDSKCSHFQLFSDKWYDRLFANQMDGNQRGQELISLGLSEPSATQRHR